MAIGPGRREEDVSVRLAVAGARELWLGGDGGLERPERTEHVTGWWPGVHRKDAAEETERRTK